MAFSYVPDFLHDANAVIELLEKWAREGSPEDFRRIKIDLMKPGHWYVEMADDKKGRVFVTGSTFNRAACICLLRASGKCQVKE